MESQFNFASMQKPHQYSSTVVPTFDPQQSASTLNRSAGNSGGIITSTSGGGGGGGSHSARGVSTNAMMSAQQQHPILRRTSSEHSSLASGLSPSTTPCNQNLNATATAGSGGNMVFLTRTRQSLDIAPSATGWVKLNVGGVVVTTSRATLCADSNSMLFAMFNDESEWKLDTDADNNVLLDLDIEYFRVILNFLRLNEIVIPPHVPHAGVLATAQFFNIQGVLNYFNREKRQIVFSWGSGGSGELGTLEKTDILTPTPVTIVSYNSRVVEVALGANYSCVLTSAGHVFTFGNGDWGQLGLGNPKLFYDKADDKTPIVTVPTKVKKLERKRVVGIATGYAYAMALTDEHEVFFWGNNNHGQSGLGMQYFGAAFRKIEEPVLVDTLQGKQIIQLGCGSFFVLALSSDGAMFSWGLVDCLGLGSPEQVRARFAPEHIAESVSKDKRTVLLTPQRVELNTQNKVVRISAGQWHSCAITDAGELFTWGVGFQGRLGHGDKDPCAVPTKVCGQLEEEHVIDVACGSFHTVALTREGMVYCWGDNANGQCGSGTLPEAVTKPHCVNSLTLVGGGIAKSISCGRQHTAVVMQGPHRWCNNWCCNLRHDGRPQADHGQVYVFGESKGMGLGSSQKVCTAKLVMGMEAYNVHRVVSGLHHTFVIAEVIPNQPQ